MAVLSQECVADIYIITDECDVLIDQFLLRVSTFTLRLIVNKAFTYNISTLLVSSLHWKGLLDFMLISRLPPRMRALIKIN